MRRLSGGVALAFFLLAAGCGDGGAPGTDGGGADLSGGGAGDLAGGGPDLAGLPAQAAEWLTAHNQVRANAMPAPSPALPPLGWNGAAASTAATWAAKCQFQHNPSSGYGENIAANSGTSSPTAVVGLWASEAANYTYASNSCAAGKTCGHYTQLVWRATTSVGCAYQKCTTNCPFSSCGSSGAWEFWVCDYDPPGNSGGAPY